MANKSPPPKYLMSAWEFDVAIKAAPIRPRTAAALRAVVVSRQTWQQAAKIHGVTESGICRAWKRLQRVTNP